MTLWFSIEVRFLNGRYHGRDGDTQPEWPPTPLRLFQAITAGALSGRWAAENREAGETALRWLESLGAPQVVLAPKAERLSPYRIAVPNNQADRHLAALRKGAHLDRLVAGEKELKVVWPRMLGRAPLIYAWEIDEASRGTAEAVRRVVRRLVVLGTGLDHAVADIRIAHERPVAADGIVSWPSGASPGEGTLKSLFERHEANLERLKSGSLREHRPTVRHRRAVPPTGEDAHLLFVLRAPAGEDDALLPVAPEAAAVLAHAIRLSLADSFATALRDRPERAPGTSPEEIERLVIGRGAGADDTARRLRVSPLPSIGHEHSDGLLRRVLVSVPAGFPLPSETIRRALNNREINVALPRSHSLNVRLASVDDDDTPEQAMLARYRGPARVWRSVSPVLLPGRVSRRQPSRDAPNEARVRADAKRRHEEGILFERALKHAGVDKVAGFRLRRDPFGPHQPRADANWRLPTSANDTKQVWLSGRPRLHAEITFDEPRGGPLLIGDGRFLGLGLFRAVTDETLGRPEIARYHVDGDNRPRVERTVFIADVLRRALMSGGFPPPELSGHDEDGPLRDDPAHAHAFFLPEDADDDGLIDHLTVYCRTGFSDRALERLRGLQRLWNLALHHDIDLSLQAIGGPEAVTGFRRLVGPSQVWRSATPYVMPRFGKRREMSAGRVFLVRNQIRWEWSARFPGTLEPEVELLGPPKRRNGRLISFDTIRVERDRGAPDKRGSFVRLVFPNPVVGPISLGRSAHFGLGLFVPEVSNS
ncbi:MAG: type I-U CRISPR-associated protein Csb2 [Parvibaculaceae bacterium]